jgi:hypothetical protein
VPTEVLVMCTRCRRPQPARKGPCVACGEALPDAPLPAASAPQAPFLLMEGGGHAISGVDRRLTYRADASAAPVVVELGKLQSVALGRRLFVEALALVPIALVLALVAPSLRPVAAVLSGLGLLGAVLWRRYFLVVKVADGERLRWPLGLVRLGSDRARLLDASWTAAARALASRGVAVREGPGSLGPSA